MVKRETANNESISTPNRYPNQENTPQTIRTSWNRASKAKNEYLLSYLKFIYNAIPIKAKNKDIKLLLSNC